MKRIKKILDHYGGEHQIRKTIEELDELKEALEEGHDIEHILEECADVMIMLNQLSLIYDFDKSTINVMMEYKIERTLLRIREEEKMIPREVSDVIHRYGNQEYKKGYDAGRSEQKRMLKAEVLKQIRAAYDRGFKDGEQEVIKAMKERAKTW